MSRLVVRDPMMMEAGRGSTAVPVDDGRLQPGRTEPYGLSTFPHPRASTAIQWLACGSAKLFTDPYTGRYVGWPRAWRDRSKVSRLPWDRCERGALMTRGLGRIPRIRGTLRQARDEVGKDASAGRYMPASGRTGYPAERTGGEGSPPGRRSPGLAPDVLGWPWHPRRLATARHRGDRVA
jgi:hypothetical protein